MIPTSLPTAGGASSSEMKTLSSNPTLSASQPFARFCHCPLPFINHQ
jgi:hypothetical protein